MENEKYEDRITDLYVELPELIHSILIKSSFDFGNDKRGLTFIAKEIKNISDAEIDSTLNMLINYKPVNFEEIIDEAI